MEYDVTPEVAERYGLDLEACRGAVFGHRHFHRERYALVGRDGHSPAELGGVHIRKWHNFGNMLIQLCNAFAFARTHGLAVVSGPEQPWFREGRIQGVRFVVGRRAQRDLLEGPFFYRLPLGLPEDNNLAKRHAVQLRKLFLVEPTAERRPRQLVIHVRSGDVFGANPHSDYAPPPLGYYLSAIEQADPLQVLVVAQDHHHPFFDDLAQACAQRGIGFDVQVSSLEDDLRALTSASMLCLSQGTMGVGAALLSHRLERVFLPSPYQAARLDPLPAQVYAATETNPFPGHWSASPEQIEALRADVAIRPLVAQS